MCHPHCAGMGGVVFYNICQLLLGAGGFAQSQTAKPNQKAAMQLIAFGEIFFKQLELGKRYRKVINAHFVKQVGFAVIDQLMETL